MPSTAIDHYSYILESSVLRITFLSGMVYEYKGISKKLYESMRAAKSKGKFLNTFIKGKFPFEKIEAL